MPSRSATSLCEEIVAANGIGGLDVKAHYNVRVPARDLQRGLGLGLLLRDPPKSLWLLVKGLMEFLIEFLGFRHVNWQ